MSIKKIYNISNKMTDDDMLELAKMLIKCGYTVKISNKKHNNRSIKYAEFGTDMEVEE